MDQNGLRATEVKRSCGLVMGAPRWQLNNVSIYAALNKSHMAPRIYGSESPNQSLKDKMEETSRSDSESWKREELNECSREGNTVSWPLIESAKAGSTDGHYTGKIVNRSKRNMWKINWKWLLISMNFSNLKYHKRSAFSGVILGNKGSK